MRTKNIPGLPPSGLGKLKKLALTVFRVRQAPEEPVVPASFPAALPESLAESFAVTHRRKFCFLLLFRETASTLERSNLDDD